MATGAAPLESSYREVVRLAASSMHAASADAPDDWLYVFLRSSADKGLNPHTVDCSVDVYLLRSDGTVVHARRSMKEQMYLRGRRAPATAPPGMMRPEPAEVSTLLRAEDVDRPYNYLVVLTRWAIHDLAAAMDESPP